MSRNAPPVAGAVAWTKQLLRRVEQPMSVFKQHPAVMQLKVHICSYTHACTVQLTHFSCIYTHCNYNHALSAVFALLFVKSDTIISVFYSTPPRRVCM